MKRIINGKIYNTETAELIVSGNNGENVGSCWYRTDQLYRTKRGNYFIYDRYPDIIPVKVSGFLDVNPDFANDITIKDWLRAWNIPDLPEREKILWEIGEA